MELKNWLSGVFLGTGRNPLETLGVKEITTIQELDAALAESNSRAVFLFKHSTTCPISASAYRRVADYLQAADGGAAPVYLIKVIESRPVSNEIASRLGVRHESPQILLVKDQASVWSASHGSIDATAMRQALEARG